jgi:hypothetical protein
MFLEVIKGRRSSSEPTSVTSAIAVDMDSAPREVVEQAGCCRARAAIRCGENEARCDLTFMTPRRRQGQNVTRITSDLHGAPRTCQFDRRARAAAVVVHHREVGRVASADVGVTAGSAA